MILDPSDFRRYPHIDTEFIVGPCWSYDFPLKHKNPEVEPLNICTVYVSGSSSSPNLDSLAAAGKLLTRFNHYVGCTGHQISDWYFDIFAPYQFVDVCYFEGSTEYGADFWRAVKFSDCPYGKMGVFDESTCLDSSEIVLVPLLACSLIEQLWMADVPVADALFERIESEELMGPEIIESIALIVRSYSDQLPAPETAINELERAEKILDKLNLST